MFKGFLSKLEEILFSQLGFTKTQVFKVDFLVFVDIFENLSYRCKKIA